MQEDGGDNTQPNSSVASEDNQPPVVEVDTTVEEVPDLPEEAVVENPIRPRIERVSVFRSPAIEQWVGDLTPSQPGDERRYVELLETPKDLLTEDDKMALREVRERLDNDHLKTHLPAQVTDLLKNAAQIVTSRHLDVSGHYPGTKDAELSEQIGEAIRNGDLRAIYKGLEARTKWLAKEVEPYNAALDAGFIAPRNTEDERSLAFDYRVGKEEKYDKRERLRDKIWLINDTMQSLAESRHVPLQHVVFSGRLIPEIPSWDEIVADPHVLPTPIVK